MGRIWPERPPAAVCVPAGRQPALGLQWRFAADTNDLGVPITCWRRHRRSFSDSRATSADTFTFTAHTPGM